MNTEIEYAPETEPINTPYRLRLATAKQVATLAQSFCHGAPQPVLDRLQQVGAVMALEPEKRLPAYRRLSPALADDTNLLEAKSMLFTSPRVALSAGRMLVYDDFFRIDRSSDNALPEEIILTTIDAFLVVHRYVTCVELQNCGLTPIEFATLHQGLSVIHEILTDFAAGVGDAPPLRAGCPIHRVIGTLLQRPTQWFRALSLTAARFLPKVSYTFHESEALERWRRGHWLCFILIQFVAAAIARFSNEVGREDFIVAERCLNQATSLMLASAAAMRLAGDFLPQHFDLKVMPSMLEFSPTFSGFDSADHAFLVSLYNETGRSFGRLPQRYHHAIARFHVAVDDAYIAHEKVCVFFDGNRRSSSGGGGKEELTGVQKLRLFRLARRRMLQPKLRKTCPLKNINKI